MSKRPLFHRGEGMILGEKNDLRFAGENGRCYT